MRTESSTRRLMREARHRLGLTQLELARRAGCSESRIAKIETGRSTPDPDLQRAIAEVLGLRTWEVPR